MRILFVLGIVIWFQGPIFPQNSEPSISILLGKDSDPNSMIRIPNSSLYLQEEAYLSFQKMNTAFQKDAEKQFPGMELKILSAFRSYDRGEIPTPDFIGSDVAWKKARSYVEAVSKDCL